MMSAPVPGHPFERSGIPGLSEASPRRSPRPAVLRACLKSRPRPCMPSFGHPKDDRGAEGILPATARI